MAGDPPEGTGPTWSRQGACLDLRDELRRGNLCSGRSGRQL
jgi:hypothetical protein